MPLKGAFDDAPQAQMGQTGRTNALRIINPKTGFPPHPGLVQNEQSLNPTLIFLSFDIHRHNTPQLYFNAQLILNI